MNSAFRKASKPEDENSTMKFRSLAGFEKAFLHFMGLLSRLPNEIDFEQIETALKTILSEKNAQSMTIVMKANPELALCALQALAHKIEPVITGWKSRGTAGIKETQQEFFAIRKNFKVAVYQNFADQPALSYLGLYHMKDKGGVWQHRNDSFVCVIGNLFIEKLLESFITPKLAMISAAEIKKAESIATADRHFE